MNNSAVTIIDNIINTGNVNGDDESKSSRFELPKTLIHRDGIPLISLQKSENTQTKNIVQINGILNYFLDQMSSKQLSFPTTNSNNNPTFKFEQLPTDLQHLTLSFLEPRMDILNVMVCNRRLKNISRSNVVWKVFRIKQEKYAEFDWLFPVCNKISNLNSNSNALTNLNIDSESKKKSKTVILNKRRRIVLLTRENLASDYYYSQFIKYQQSGQNLLNTCRTDWHLNRMIKLIHYAFEIFVFVISNYTKVISQDDKATFTKLIIYTAIQIDCILEMHRLIWDIVITKCQIYIGNLKRTPIQLFVPVPPILVTHASDSSNSNSNGNPEKAGKCTCDEVSVMSTLVEKRIVQIQLNLKTINEERTRWKKLMEPFAKELPSGAFD